MSEKDEKDGQESVHSSVSASESGRFFYLMVLKILLESKLTFCLKLRFSMVFNSRTSPCMIIFEKSTFEVDFIRSSF